MKDIVSRIEELRLKLDRYRREDLKEIPTRRIFVDPLLQALGWDLEDSHEVELEYPTIDQKSVDYAAKVNRKPVLFIEAKPLNDPLTDVKSITQVVGYATNEDVEWCILTNGVTYKVYRSTERAQAPDKLLFEVSIDPRESKGMSVQQIADQFNRFSRDAMARGVLDEVGEQVFTIGKVRKAVDKLFLDAPANLVRIIRRVISDESIRPAQVKAALKRLLAQSSESQVPSLSQASGVLPKRRITPRTGKDYGEEDHIKGKPREVKELFRRVDKFCQELAPGSVQRRYLAKYVSYVHGKAMFCSVHVQKGGLRIWVKLNYSRLENPPDYVRDVSNVGHWGVGDVEVAIDTLDKLHTCESYIKQSFERNR